MEISICIFYGLKGGEMAGNVISLLSSCSEEEGEGEGRYWWPLCSVETDTAPQ